MNAYLSLGRWFFVLPFVAFGVWHFTDTQAYVENVVPAYLPAKQVLVYLSGAALIICSALMLIGKYDRTAAVVLSIILLGFVFTVHLPNTLNDFTREAALTRLLNNLALAGGAMIYARYVAEDK